MNILEQKKPYKNRKIKKILPEYMSKISLIHFMFICMYTIFPPDPFQEIILKSRKKCQTFKLNF